MKTLLTQPAALQQHIMCVLWERNSREFSEPVSDDARVAASSVLFLLGRHLLPDQNRSEICLILTKRSRKVRQAGDLCCPGGTVSLRLDSFLAKLLQLPGTPLSRWPHWSALRSKQPRAAEQLATLLATSLREGWEELRLNPLGVRFLGSLPSRRLVLFRMVIHPLVAWLGRQKRFHPSWEVGKIVAIPLRELMNPENYCRYRLYITPNLEQRLNRTTQDFPCFRHHDNGDVEVLWGATYHIVMLFLELVFGFQPPDVAGMPFIPGLLDEGYLNGRD
jgi:hypothetical protein